MINIFKPKLKRIFILCVSFAMFFILYKVDVRAVDVDTNKRCDLQIELDENGTPLSGVTFNIYHVADVNEDGSYTELDSRFSGYKIDPQYNLKEDWDEFAYTLDMIIIRDGISCDGTRSTGSDGRLLFDGLNAGLYMVSGLEYRHGHCCHEINPFMVSLPYFDGDDWKYDVIARPKFPGESEDPVKQTFNIIFLWDDEGYEDQRPDKVDIALVKINNDSEYAKIPFLKKCYAFEKSKVNDYGTIVGTATVTADMGWRYTWTGIDYGHEYDIVSENLDNYYITASYDKQTFVFKHRIAGGTPGGGDTPGGEDTPDPDKDTSGGTDGDNLPQTGQLWWPVPFMIALGLLLCVLGLARRKGDNDE